MNTVRSFWLGWGAVTAAGAGAYYFAKQEINKDRQAKLAQHRQRIVADRAFENNEAPRDDSAGSPSQEASSDPAPTRHAPSTEGERVNEKSKYETARPFVSKKGDRFS